MPEVTPFQVLIVDDHPLMRRGIRQLLELDPAFYVVAEAGDGASAIDLANRIEPCGVGNGSRRCAAGR
ncbi:response regulator [Salmonella enterica subsp. enterica serovar Lubbock]|nr:response regulator [Salmonella enterica subsp. enterica serovar Lubbock]